MAEKIGIPNEQNVAPHCLSTKALTPLMVASKRYLTLLSNRDQQFCSRLIIGRTIKQRKHTKPELRTCFKDYITGTSSSQS